MATTTNYAYTGGVQSFVVPGGVYGYLVKLWGASGGGAAAPNGLGGYTEGNLAVTPGQTVYVYVGGNGQDLGLAGYNGGGESTSAGRDGGGGTDIRVGGTALADRKAVAGGGGGVGSSGIGGVGGGLVAGNGTGTKPGLGGTQLAGGTAGGDGSSAGALGQGGNSGSFKGAGGGGYYGGGGAGGTNTSDNSGGGGGSSYHGGLTGADTQSGIWMGNGKASFTVSSMVPNAPILTSPIGNAYIPASLTNTFTWAYSVDTAQAQTGYDLRYRVVGNPTWTTVSNAATSDAFRDITSGTFTAGSSYEWQVRTTNSAGTGPWSSSGFFRAATPPAAPVITAPALNSDVETGDTVDWTATNQTYYQFRRVADLAGSPNTSIVYEDSGTVVESGTRSRALMFTVNNRYEHLQVRVFHNTLWSTWASRRVHALADRPLDPNVYLTADPDTASIDVHWSTPTPGVDDVIIAYNEIWVIDFDTWVRVATNLGNSGTFTYWTPRSGQDYDLRIRVIGVGVDGSTSEGIPSGAIGEPFGSGIFGDRGPYGE